MHACLHATGVAAIAIAMIGSAHAGERIKRMSDVEQPTAGHGAVLFSQVRTDKRDPWWAFEFSRAGDKKKSLIGREKEPHRLDCERNGGVVAISLPPGDYELGRWRIDSAAFRVGPVWTATKQYDGPKDHAMPIRVEAGEVTYLGEISIDEAQGNAATFTDRFECDKGYLGRSWPWMVGWPVRKAPGLQESGES